MALDAALYTDATHSIHLAATASESRIVGSAEFSDGSYPFTAMKYP